MEMTGGPKRFRVTFLIAVFNVEEYIRKAVDSLLAQSIGFEQNIQIVFVDDGSEDCSGQICDEYQQRFPNNIVVVHKENEGQAKARLTGLPYVEGELVGFFDPDDTLSVNTVEDVLSFYDETKGQTDVYAIPMFFFGDLKGPHPLNDKFNKGSRIIDLLEEEYCAQMSLASSFICRPALNEMEADDELITAEDARELIRILTKKNTLGVVKEAKYYYRKRKSSSVGQAQKHREWYTTYLIHFSEWALDYCQDQQGFIPRFVQYTVMYDLQWKYKNRDIPANILTKEEEAEYQDKLFSVVKRIDDDVILAQKSIYIEHKLYALFKKHGAPQMYLDKAAKDIYLCYDKVVCHMSKLVTQIHFIRMNTDSVHMEVEQMVPEIGLPEHALIAKINGVEHTMSRLSFEDVITSAGVRIAQRIAYSIDLPYPDHAPSRISFSSRYGNLSVSQTQVQFKKYSPVNNEVPGSYYYKNGYMLTPTKTGISLRKATKREALHQEWELCKGLICSHKQQGAKKALAGRLLAKLYGVFKKKKIWLVCDKADRADDNGEAFFLYLQSLRLKDVDVYFLIDKNSHDFSRLKRQGKVIPYMSWRHKVLYLNANYIASAYSHDEISNPFLWYSRWYGDMLQKCKYVFLQHGIIKDDLSQGLNRFHKNIRLFVTSTERERASVIDNPKYGYSEDEVILSGLPRYDRLYHQEEKAIVIMPTWRRELFGGFHSETSLWDLNPGFEESAYYQFYTALLNDERLLQAAERLGYQINFVPHPILFPYLDHFHVPSQVAVWNSDVVYRDMFAKNMLLLTDYSSVAFDFAYLRKPVVYAHFDTNHYEEGYFNYEEDGFGEVEYSLEATIDRLVEYMENGCKLKENYRTRINEFFCYQDRNNCLRVYEAMKALEQTDEGSKSLGEA